MFQHKNNGRAVLSLALLYGGRSSCNSDEETSVSCVCLTELHLPSNRMKDATLQEHKIVCSEHDNGFCLNPVKRCLTVQSVPLLLSILEECCPWASTRNSCIGTVYRSHRRLRGPMPSCLWLHQYLLRTFYLFPTWHRFTSLCLNSTVLLLSWRQAAARVFFFLHFFFRSILRQSYKLSLISLTDLREPTLPLFFLSLSPTSYTFHSAEQLKPLDV